MDDFLNYIDTQQTQESLYHQWIDECSTCSLPRFQHILQALPSEWKLSAVHTAVRHLNRPALKWYLNQSPRGIPDILLYCCQLNYVELIMYLGQSIFKYQLQDLLTEDEKYSCIWWSFHHQNTKIIVALMIYLQVKDSFETLVEKDTERRSYFSSLSLPI